MKKLLILIIPLLFSCNAKKEWSKEDKEFAEWQCAVWFGLGIGDYCQECYVKKLVEKFDSLDESMDALHEVQKKVQIATFNEDYDLLNKLDKEAAEIADLFFILGDCVEEGDDDGKNLNTNVEETESTENYLTEEGSLNPSAEPNVHDTPASSRDDEYTPQTIR